MRELQQGRQSELWQALIRESASDAGLQLDETAECYLGFVLIQHLRDDQLAAHVLALDWLQAQESIGQARAEALRTVGDRCLLIAGLYPQLAQRRRVTPDYYAALGRDAYVGVAECTRRGEADLFALLARIHRELVRVLRGLRRSPAVPLLAL